MSKILRWEPMTLLGKPVADMQQAVLDDPVAAVRVYINQNGWGSHRAIIEIQDPATEADVIVTWPNAEPDHGISEDRVKAWAERVLPTLVGLGTELFESEGARS